MTQQNININTNTNTNVNVDLNLNDHQLTEETLGLAREGITSFSAATPHLCYFVQDSSELFFLKGELLAAGEKIAFTKTQQKENPYLFYELPSLEAGKIILKQLFNKRFLKNEHSYFNISDPLDGWWLERNQKTLTLWFRNKGRSFLGEKNRPQMDKSYLSPLGPIGDSSLFSQFLRPLKNSFSSSFSSHKNTLRFIPIPVGLLKIAAFGLDFSSNMLNLFSIPFSSRFSFDKVKELAENNWTFSSEKQQKDYPVEFKDSLENILFIAISEHQRIKNL